MMYVLPGMGADTTMFREPWRSLDNCVFADWPPYGGERSLRAVAERVVSTAGIVDGDVVVGHSLGGMVACEIAVLRKLKHLVLISSAQRKEEVSGLFALLHPLAAITPFRLGQVVARNLPGDLYKMFARSDPDFIRATCKAIFQWEGLAAASTSTKRIHGRHDRVIPLPQHVDLPLDGGHLIPITHARDCVEFIRALP